jgi:hypothetical protein
LFSITQRGGGIRSADWGTGVWALAAPVNSKNSKMHTRFMAGPENGSLWNNNTPDGKKLLFVWNFILEKGASSRLGLIKGANAYILMNIQGYQTPTMNLIP